MQEPYQTWDPAQVALYLLPLVEGNIVDTFIENNIDGSLLPFLTTEHLLELGILQLSQRLRVKHEITKLIHEQYGEDTIGKANDLNRLKNIDIDSNYVSIEALNLCMKLLHEMPQPATTKEVKKLEEHFRKLRADLGPVVRLANEAKPLPVPTLDPGPSKSLPTHNTSFPISSTPILPHNHESESGASTLNFPQAPLLVRRASTNDRQDHSDHGLAPKPQIVRSRANHTQPVSSPSNSNRWSTASILSTGVGRLAEMKQATAARVVAKPRLVEASPIESDSAGNSPNGLHTVTFRHPLKSKPSMNLISTTHSTSGHKDIQPLQTFKASSEDTGLRLLQNAIRKNNIPRENWSKYALVICYDDKERIVKLTEKPVSIFKELQEQGKNPTIMLRELVTDDPENGVGGEDIPGGMF